MPRDLPDDQNSNNAAMDILNPPGDESESESGTPPPSPADDNQPEPGAQSAIQKVPGGYQVSVVVPTLDEAHALSKQFHVGKEQEDQSAAQPGSEDEQTPPAENEDASQPREGLDEEP